MTCAGQSLDPPKPPLSPFAYLRGAVEYGVNALEPEYIYPDAPKGTWSSGICQCMSHIPSCLIGCCCGCITVGQVMVISYIYI